VKRGDGAEEDTSDRGRASSSRGAFEAVSILRPPRKLSCKGGSVTRRVTRCQRRSRVRSERRARAGFPRAAREGQHPSSLPHGPPKRVQYVVKRRILRSPPFTSVKGTKQVGNRERGYGFRKKEWLAEVGRTHRDIRVRARVPSLREVVGGVDARGGTSEGESVCRCPCGISYRTPQRNRFVRESVRRPFTTEGVLGRSNARSSPGVQEAVLTHG